MFVSFGWGKPQATDKEPQGYLNESVSSFISICGLIRS